MLLVIVRCVSSQQQINDYRLMPLLDVTKAAIAMLSHKRVDTCYIVLSLSNYLRALRPRVWEIAKTCSSRARVAREFPGF